MVRYVNLDNAATTPAMRRSWTPSTAFLPLLRQRPPGHRLQVPGEHRRLRAGADIVGAFVGADPERDVVVFGKNTTDAINLLARSLPCRRLRRAHHDARAPLQRPAVAGPGPHRPRPALADGTLDVDDLDRLLARHAGRIALLAVTGASNVTGVVPPIHDLAERVHAAGGRILVDAAQLAAHRPIDMRPHDDPGHLDFVALSAHKMYAPFGTGALIGRRDGFAAAPTTPAAAPCGPSPSTTSPGPTCPTARRAAARTSSAPSPSPPRPRTLTRDRPRPHRRPRERAARLRPGRAGGCPGRARSTARGDRAITLEGWRHPVHRRRHRPRPRRRGPRLRARDRRAQRVLLRPALRRPPARTRPGERRPLDRQGAAATSAARPAWCASASVATTTRRHRPRDRRPREASSPATSPPTTAATNTTSITRATDDDRRNHTSVLHLVEEGSIMTSTGPSSDDRRPGRRGAGGRHPEPVGRTRRPHAGGKRRGAPLGGQRAARRRGAR